MTDFVEKVSSTETGGKMSSAALRKIKKPIIERRRRERINDSLNQLKTLVLEAMNKDESRFSKMEKADILEMTVKHLKAVQRQQAPVQQHQQQPNTDIPVVVTKYKAGFSECAKEVTRYLNTVDGLVPDVRNRLVNHLNNVVNTNVSKVANNGQVQSNQQQPHILPAQILPNATPITSLPGLPVLTTANVQQHNNVNNNNVQNSNVVLTKNGPVAIVPQQMVQQIQLPSGVVAVMSPGSPSFPEGAQSPTQQNAKNVIPLYVNTSGITQLAYSPPSQQSMKSDSPNSSVSSYGSPRMGDEAPETRSSPSPVYITNHTTTHSEKLIKLEPRNVLHHQVAPTQSHPMTDCKDVWRPW